MAEPTTIEIRDLSPPGDILGEALDERGMSQAELARRTGLTEKHVSQLVNAVVPLSMEVALQLERVLGIPARLWHSLEFNYRSELKRQEQRSALREFSGWARKFPVRKMIEFGFLSGVGRDVVSRVEALLDFFGVTSPEAWDREWISVTARFRKSPAFTPDRHALTAWLRQGEITAQRNHCAPYNKSRFREVLRQARAFTTAPPDVFEPELVRLCSSAGVALAFVPSLPRLAISGASRWFGPDKAAVFLSLRHRSDDQLWFSFFHEVCHVLEHKTSAIFIHGTGLSDDDPDEVRANQFARDFLIPPDRYRLLVAEGRPTLAKIEAFAQETGIAPGIVVGRLQFEGIIPHTNGNRLKRIFKWNFEC